MEEWKPIHGYEGMYEVSNLGRIRSIKRNGTVSRDTIRAQHESPNGYMRINLTNKGVKKWHLVHRLVAEAYVPNVDGKQQVNHIDGDKHNNRADNLEWVTARENIKHSFDNGLHAVPSKEHMGNMIKRMKDVVSVRVMRSDGVIFESMSEAARQTGIRESLVSRCCSGELKTTHGYSFKKI